MNYSARIAALLLVIIMAFSLASCSTADTTYALTVGDTKISAGVYIGYLINAYTNALDFVDTSKDIWTQKVDGKEFKQYVIDTAVSDCLRQIATAKKFDELKLTMTDADKTSVKTRLDNIWSYMGSVYEKSGCSSASLKTIIESDVKAGKVFNSYYDKGGSKAVPEAEIKAYFKENFSLIRAVSINFLDKNGATVTEDVRAKRIEIAKDYYNRTKNGIDFKTIIKDFETWYSSEFGTQLPDFTDTYYENSYQVLNKNTTSISDALKVAVFDSPAGVPQLVEEADRVSVILRSDIMTNASYYDEYRTTALSNLKNEEFVTMVKTWTADLKYTLNEAAISRYDPKNIKTSG